MLISASILLVLVVGAPVEANNTVFTLYFRIHSLLVTLGLGTFLAGLTLWFSGVLMALI